MKKLQLSTYEIIFYHAAEVLQNFLNQKQYEEIFVLVDENTRKHCLPNIIDVLPDRHKVIEIQSGEANKNLNTCKFIWEELLKGGANRHSLLINLGGGVIGDMGGFCASSYMRGIDFIQIPTTLLSQVDSSVGSKLGVDFQGIKNIIGVFGNPVLVIIDTEFFDTLDLRQLLSGYAEILKHALIQDKSLWHELKYISKVDKISTSPLVFRSVEIKKQVVEQDPTEKGLRKILNFGHTLGHAIETYFLDTPNTLLHGEAIALGMIGEALICCKKGMINDTQLLEITNVVGELYSKINYVKIEVDVIYELMKHDKKNKKSVILASLIPSIGDCEYDIAINKEDVKDALDYLEEITSQAKN